MTMHQHTHSIDPQFLLSTFIFLACCQSPKPTRNVLFHVVVENVARIYVSAYPLFLEVLKWVRPIYLTNTQEGDDVGIGLRVNRLEM